MSEPRQRMRRAKVLREYIDSGDPEKYQSTHHERDQATDLDYRGARFYDSDLARFLSLDPHDFIYPDWSPFHYVAGNPIILVDPDGKSVDDFYIFNEKGEYQGVEKNDEDDQIVVENSQSGERSFHFFNDPEHDVALLKANFELYTNGGIGRKFLFFISNEDVNSMMQESGVKKMNNLKRFLFVGKEPKPRKLGGMQITKGKIDFSAYHLGRLIREKMKDAGRRDPNSENNDIGWGPSDLGLGGQEKRSPFFIFSGDENNTYNYMDAGNWLWGNAVGRTGGTKENVRDWSRKYNPNDSQADYQAILLGHAASQSE